MEITPGIHLIDGSVGCNTYLIMDTELTLIDTGLRGNIARIEKYLHRLGYELRDIRRIVITHAHLDHMNCLYDLKKDTGAVVIAGTGDADLVSGRRKLQKPRGFIAQIYELVDTFYHYKPVPVDIELKDREKVPGVMDFVAISLPGHSEGNMGLFSASKRILFSSDSVRVIESRIATPGEKFTADMATAISSIGKMCELDFDVLLPGHGSPIMAGSAEKVRHLYHEVKHY